MFGSEWLVALICVAIFFGAGRHEARFGGNDNSVLWAALSIGVSALVVLVFKGKTTHLFVAQVALFIAIGVVRALREPK